jgi:endoglucanase
MGKGMNTFRLPFMWERLQNSQFAAFNPAELNRLDNVVNYATGQEAYVILNPHNFARYYGNVIGGGTVPTSAFADFWSKLASHYQDNPRVIFGLVNEPNTMSTELWRDDANAAIATIRATGATNLILVPGNAWTGAWSWEQNWYGTPNAQVMLEIVDPGHNYAFEVHQYLDADASGTSAICVSATVGSERLVIFTNWLQAHGKRGFLGEFAGGRNNTCYAALNDMLEYVDGHADVWLGWTYWSAGPWWPADYIFTLEPQGGVDRPQMTVLSQHLPPGQKKVYLPFIIKP